MLQHGTITCEAGLREAPSVPCTLPLHNMSTTFPPLLSPHSYPPPPQHQQQSSSSTALAMMPTAGQVRTYLPPDKPYPTSQRHRHSHPSHRSPPPIPHRLQAPPHPMDPPERPAEPRRHGASLVYAEAFLAHPHAQTFWINRQGW